jgi:DNA-binding response OmpR family regulator
MKILIAEDDPVSRRLLEAKLAKWGYDVVVTCDGDEAWEALRAKDTPRLAILDWMMPGMDGVEICRRMRMEGTVHIHNSFDCAATRRGYSDRNGGRGGRLHCQTVQGK